MEYKKLYVGGKYDDRAYRYVVYTLKERGLLVLKRSKFGRRYWVMNSYFIDTLKREISKLSECESKYSNRFEYMLYRRLKRDKPSHSIKQDQDKRQEVEGREGWEEIE